MFKYLWTIPALGRPIARQPLSILSQNGHIRIQRVRIGRPFFTRKRTRIILLGSTAALLCYFSLDITVEEENDEKDRERRKEKLSKRSKIDSSADLVKAAIKEKHGASTTHGILGDASKAERNAQRNDTMVKDEDGEKDGENQEENQEDAIFIPFGFVHELPRTYYKGTDPEWQSFFEFSVDRRKINSVQRELGDLICQDISSKGGFQKALGTPIKLVQYWIDFIIPDGPPPEYEQSGIEITAEDISWTTRPMSAMQYSRLRIILQPLPMLSALWASCRIFWSLQLARIHEIVTLHSKQEDLNTSSPTALLSLQRFVNAGQHDDTQLNASIEGPPPEPKKDPYKDDLANDPSEVASKSGQLSSSTDLSPLGQDMKIALKAFETTLARKWNGPAIEFERGALFVSGLVMLQGSKGNCTLDVIASYHPQESRWVSYDIIDIRHLGPSRQGPSGGV